MAAVSPALPVKAVCAVTFSAGIRWEDAVSGLENLLGPADGTSPVFPFDFTDYYSGEMGPGLRKLFVSFETLMAPGDLARVKRASNGLEAGWAVDGRRRVNLDPGYVTSAKLVVASAKDFAHRVCLGDGIYGDVQLQYRHGRWRRSAWTFPDYRTPLAFAFFTGVRDRYNQQERRLRHAVP
ncbi:MAG: DUF4416 family protein [bacterium]|nr:DUF4416 family protein [bacterium]